MPHTVRSRMIAACVLASAVCGTASAAHELQVLLTVQSAEGAVTYDAEALAALGTVEVTTSTIWTDGAQHFTGVPLDVVLADAGISEGSITARAINDYAVEIPVADIARDHDGLGPIIAYQRNGSPMAVRDKGPLWLIFPYDSKAEFQSEVIYARSIWQLDRISQSR